MSKPVRIVGAEYELGRKAAQRDVIPAQPVDLGKYQLSAYEAGYARALPPVPMLLGEEMVKASDYDAIAARCAELTDLLSRCSTECNQLSHRRGEYHEYDEACPVAMKIERALTPGEKP